MASDREAPFPNQGQQPQLHGRNARQMPDINFSEEELLVIRNCFKEAFWYRSMPLFIAGFAGIRFLTRRGILRNVNPIVATARDVGMLMVSGFIGRVLYSDVCKQKIMELPNSKLAEAIRSGKTGADMIAFMGAQSNQTVQQQVGPVDSSEFDSRQADYHRRDRGDNMGKMEDTNERYRPSSMDSEMKMPLDLSDKPKIYNSYDQLRQQNRSQYDNKHGMPSSPTSDQSQAPRPPPSYNQPSPSATPSRYKTNQWGDVIEE